MLDSGIGSGPNVARALVCYAYVSCWEELLCTAWLHSVKRGGSHAINLLKAQLEQLMAQVNCGRVNDSF